VEAHSEVEVPLVVGQAQRLPRSVEVVAPCLPRLRLVGLLLLRLSVAELLRLPPRSAAAVAVAASGAARLEGHVDDHRCTQLHFFQGSHVWWKCFSS